MQIILSGCSGHMGHAVAEIAKTNGTDVLFGVDICPQASYFPVFSSFDEAAGAVECFNNSVIIDFSNPGCLDSLLSFAVKYKIPSVICTTGFTDDQLQKINAASKQIPIFRSANMSLGVALLSSLCRKAASVLGDNFDVEIVEAHHNRKADAPSGTANMLYNAIADEYSSPRMPQFGRSGADSKRKHNEIGIHSIRGGTVTGEHQVYFLGDSERIVLSHSAENRDVFASGALKAAEFLADKAAGMYNMNDIVGDI